MLQEKAVAQYLNGLSLVLKAYFKAAVTANNSQADYYHRNTNIDNTYSVENFNKIRPRDVLCALMGRIIDGFKFIVSMINQRKKSAVMSAFNIFL